MRAVKIENRLVNSYRNTISEWAVGFRYGNFFIPWVENNLKISPWEEEIPIPETRPILKSYIHITQLLV
jgi:hypothetical protein